MSSSLCDTTRIVVATIALALMMAISPAPADCFPWSIDMYRGPEVQPLAEAPRVTPADTLPVHGEPPMSLEQMTIKMHDPLQPTAQNLAAGREQFETYCAPCHGATGQGNGPVAHVLSKPPKNLISGTSKDLPDGYIYGISPRLSASRIYFKSSVQRQFGIEPTIAFALRRVLSVLLPNRFNCLSIAEACRQL
jgi:cytochrome c553